MKYIRVDVLQEYCDKHIDHSITPNVFPRMNHIEIVRCKDCVLLDTQKCPMKQRLFPNGNFFCGLGKRKEGDRE